MNCTVLQPVPNWRFSHLPLSCEAEILDQNQCKQLKALTTSSKVLVAQSHARTSTPQTIKANYLRPGISIILSYYIR